MGFTTSTTTCRVQLLSYHRLPAATVDLCALLRREAGRCWSDLVAAHVAARTDGRWLTDADLRAMSKGGEYALHSQSIQALGQKLLANVATARELRARQRTAGAVGDVRHIADGVDKGAMANQKLAQWPHGQLVQALRYKARAAGISLEELAEDYSTRTCSGCGHVRSNTPRGRVYVCTNPGCGVRTVHRDANGAANICSRARYGVYGQVQVQQVKHLRATVVRATTRANVARSAQSPPQAETAPREASRF